MANEKTLGTEYLMPFERTGADSPAEAHESLLGVLASENEAPTTDEKEPEPEAEAEGEPEAEASVEGEAEDAEEASDAEGEAESETEEPEAPPTYRVKVDGQEVAVPLDELLKGYSRTADYTRKTTDVANQRKALEAREVEVGAVRDRYEHGLKVIADHLKEQLPPAPDEALRSTNPGAYAVQKQDREEAERLLSGVLAEHGAVAAARQEQERLRWEADMEAGFRRLPEVIPEWADPEKSADEQGRVVEYASRVCGWPPEQLARITDPFALATLRKAMLYDEMQTKGKEAIKEKIKPTKVQPLQPGGRSQQPATKKAKDGDREKAMRRLSQTGRMDDAAAAILGLLKGQ